MQTVVDSTRAQTRVGTVMAESDSKRIVVRRQGVPVVVSSPSGGGKTTMCHRVIERTGGVEFSVSHTTRQPRAGERDGIDYHFVDAARFAALVEQNAFLEWAHVHGRLYGTGRAQSAALLERGVDVFFDIDVQGARQIQARLPEAVLIFVVPPSMAVLEARLRARRSDSDEEIRRRLQVAATEIEAATFYTHMIVNDHLDGAVRDLEHILQAERLRRIDKATLVADVLGRSGTPNTRL